MRAPFALVAVAVIASGSDSVGGVVSTTVTLNVALEVKPMVLEAEHVTAVEPIAKVEPDGGLHATGTLPSSRSVALAANVTTAPFGPVASAVMSCGTVSFGGEPTTVIVNVALDA